MSAQSYDYKSRCFSNLLETTGREGGYTGWTGYAHTPNGTVGVWYLEYFLGKTEDPYGFSMSMVFKGEKYERVITGRRFTKIGIIRKAHAFARDVTGGQA